MGGALLLDRGFLRRTLASSSMQRDFSSPLHSSRFEHRFSALPITVIQLWPESPQLGGRDATAARVCFRVLSVCVQHVFAMRTRFHKGECDAETRPATVRPMTTPSSV